MGKIVLDAIETRAPKGWVKSEIKAQTNEIIAEIAELKKLLVATQKHSILIILQGMDASGKDGTVRTIFSGVNPSSFRVESFKKPTEKEFAHDFLWRVHQVVPQKGEMVVFNRSHYEDILVPTVGGYIDQKTIDRRYEHINNFEALLEDSGTKILKFYLHVSKNEQLERLTERVENPEKHWKHNDGDWETREHWKAYRKVYEDIFEKCNKTPWHIIPVDQNWVKVHLIAKEILKALKAFKMEWPPLESERFKDRLLKN